MTTEYGMLTLASFIFVFGFLSYLISWVYTKNLSMTKTQFLLADRKLGFFESSFSIAATWIWAPALFVSAQKAFQDGWLGLFWFTVPNILCLILFSKFAVLAREKYPDGFTLSAIIAEKYTPRVQSLYWFTLIGLTTCAFAVQLLAGGTVLSKFLGISYHECTIILAFLPLAYSLAFGLRASIITDFVKMIMILTLGLTMVPFLVSNVGVNVIIDGLGGKAGNTDFFSLAHLNLFLTFGLPVTIGLLSGPFGDQSFWQRAFATKQEVVGKSFVTAAFIFGIVPILMGTLGFIAVGTNAPIKNPGFVNLELISSTMGLIGTTVFFFIVMSAITSILDSKLCSMASIFGNDISKRRNSDEHIRYSAYGMLTLTLIALLIANLPGLKVLHLFLFYGTLRASTFIPTIMLLLEKPLAERGVFYGVLCSLFVGLPTFAYGNFNNDPKFIVTGSLLTLLLPLIVNIGFRR